MITNNTITKEKLAAACAGEHINYLCRMAGNIGVIKNPIKTQENLFNHFMDCSMEKLMHTVEWYKERGGGLCFKGLI